MRQHPNIEGLDVSDPWPYEATPEMKMQTGPWQLVMSKGGGTTLWPTEKRIPFVFDLTVCYRGTKKEMERFLGTFCRMGYEKYQPHNPEWQAYQYTEGQVWIFNWRSWNNCQFAIASQIAEALCDTETDRNNEAWDIGKAFAERIDNAEQAHFIGSGPAPGMRI